MIRVTECWPLYGSTLYRAAQFLYFGTVSGYGTVSDILDTLYMKRYLIRRGKRSKPITHIWTGSDTACKMVSNGGIHYDPDENKWVLIDRVIGKMCEMCKTNSLNN